MTQQQWQTFTAFRNEFKEKCTEWSSRLPNLMELQKNAALSAGTPEYSFQTPVVFNTDLDKITQADEIKLIVIGDNPGKDEQLTVNQRYLCGQAGKIAEGYFKRNPELGVDFRKNVIILNKTPIHSAKTNQLKKMIKDGGQEFKSLLDETQIWMAQKTAQLHQELWLEAEKSGAKSLLAYPELWLVGYSELNDKSVFAGYKKTLMQTYDENKASEKSQTSGAHSAWKDVYVFQHFSMNRFSIDLNSFMDKKKNLSLGEAIHELGKIHKEEIMESKI